MFRLDWKHWRWHSLDATAGSRFSVNKQLSMASAMNCIRMERSPRFRSEGPKRKGELRWWPRVENELLQKGSDANFLRVCFCPGEKALQNLGGEDRCPKFRSGGFRPGQWFEVELLFLDFLRQFDAADRHRRRLESLEPEHRPDPLLYSPVILLDNVVTAELCQPGVDPARLGPIGEGFCAAQETGSALPGTRYKGGLRIFNDGIGSGWMGFG